jgi:hypothetical protein
MAFVSGPESSVWVPGARERDESREVAKVRVTWGLLWLGVEDGGGRYGESSVREGGGKCKEGFGGGFAIAGCMLRCVESVRKTIGRQRLMLRSLCGQDSSAVQYKIRLTRDQSNH